MLRSGKLVGVIVVFILLIAFPAWGGTTERVSVSSVGQEGNSSSYVSPLSFISSDGRYVAFSADASNLVEGDTNGASDVFVYDRLTSIVERVSIGLNGTESNGSGSRMASISADGRYVAFESTATNLIEVDLNGGAFDVFVYDRITGVMELVSVSSEGLQGNSHAGRPSISGDGRYVSFQSYADNLVPGDTNNTTDNFIHDTETGITQRVNVGSDGTQAYSPSYYSSINYDGRYVVFHTESSLSPEDTNGVGDIYVRDILNGTTEMVSIASDGSQANAQSEWRPSISADGRYVAFSSYASNLIEGDTNNANDIYVHNLQTGQTTLVSISSSGQQGNGDSFEPSISSDGRYVAFASYASNLVEGDTNGATDIFVHDMLTGQTERLSVDSSGQEAWSSGDLYYQSRVPSISSEGKYIAFKSFASNLVPDDTNGVGDVFVRVRDLDKDADGYNEVTDCNDNDPSIHPNAAEIKHDGIDQDCNGYDLTINITKASYIIAEDSLKVEATSTLGASAGLELNGYGPMEWKENKLEWQKAVQPAGGNPGTVTVCGIEGCETVQVVAE